MAILYISFWVVKRCKGLWLRVGELKSKVHHINEAPRSKLPGIKSKANK
jgi:Zn-finger nucleic acid-binding protein